MDSTVKQMLDGFRYSVSSYAASLGENNEKLNRAKKLIDSLYAKAEEGADITAITIDPEFGEAGALVGALASEPPLPAGERIPGSTSGGETVSEVPSASVVAVGYHMAFDALDAAARETQGVYYNRIFQLEETAENAVHFNTLLLEDGVLLEMARDPLIAAAEQTLKQAETVFSPTVDFQQKQAVITYSEVKTVAELEFEATKMAELSNVEHVWDAQFIEVLGLLPGCAQAIEAFGPTDDNLTKLRKSYRFMAEFMGITWSEVFEDPRYLLFWNNVLWPIVPAEKRAKYSVDSADGWRDLLKEKFYDPFVANEPVPQADADRAFVKFWGEVHPVHSALGLLNAPPRPEIAGS